MHKKIFFFSYRLLLIISLFLGIALNIYRAENVTVILSYYTLQINIFCFLVFIILSILDILKLEYKNDFYYFLKGEMVVSMLLMLIVYYVALNPNHFTMHSFEASDDISNFLVHLINPILVGIDYLLFDKKGNFKLHHPIMWIILPLCYVAYVYIYSYYGGTFYSIGGSKKFAYLFLDYEIYGYVKTGVWIVFIATFTISIGYILILIDKGLGKLLNKK